MEILKKYLRESFNGLEFNADLHKYYLNGQPLNDSVSSKLKQFYTPFNSDAISNFVALKRKISKEDVKAEWKQSADEAIAIGNKTHLFGELYAFDRNIRPSSGYEVAVMKFWNQLPDHIVPVCCELQMYHWKDLYPGTSDIVLYNTNTGKLIIADYKTNKDLYKNYRKQKMLAPFDDLLDCPLSKYKIQLSYYQILLEQTSMEVEDRVIVWVKPDGTYELIRCEDYTDILRQY